MIVASLARWWGPLVAYMAVIFWLSSGELPEVAGSAPDVALHAGAYFLLAMLAVRAFAKGLARPAPSWTLWAGVVLAVAYGVGDEWHQSFVTGRVASAVDVLADGVGALGAVLFLKGIAWSDRTRRLLDAARKRISTEESS